MSGKPIVHVEIPAQDPQKSGQFYKAIFDWDIQAAPEFDYVMFDGKPGPGGGFPRIDGEMYKANDVTVYIDSEDIDGTLRRIESLGGKVLLAKTEIPGTGWFAFFADPAGNRMALYTPVQRV